MHGNEGASLSMAQTILLSNNDWELGTELAGGRTK
jgi:hypothetical protein